MSLADYGELRDYWIDNPPPHISLQLCARALGVDLEKLKPERPYGEMAPLSGPSIAELAAAAKIAPGGDTLDASRRIFRQLEEASDGRR